MRWISAAPYADRVVHHALCNVVEPLIDRRLVFDCWANRKGKGSHRAVLRYQRFAGCQRYALKVDIRKYFPSIDHTILKDQLGRIFKDRRLLALMHQIVEGGQVPEPHQDFPGDDLFAPLDRPKGLPIGNLTSQLWANLYLNDFDFDHWVNQHLGCRGYVRFVDDFILLADSKPVLHEWKEAIVDRLRACRLQVHPRKNVILRTSEGVPFLGYVVWPGRIRVRGETVRRFRRRLRRRGGEGPSPGRRQSLAAWKGHVQLAGSWRRVAPNRDSRGPDAT